MTTTTTRGTLLERARDLRQLALHNAEQSREREAAELRTRLEQHCRKAWTNLTGESDLPADVRTLADGSRRVPIGDGVELHWYAGLESWRLVSRCARCGEDVIHGYAIYSLVDVAAAMENRPSEHGSPGCPRERDEEGNALPGTRFARAPRPQVDPQLLPAPETEFRQLIDAVATAAEGLDRIASYLERREGRE